MTGKGSRDEQYRTVLVNHWVAKARDDLGSAQVNLQSGRLSNAVRDIYFACFHVVSAFFMNEGKAFKKHSQVRASFRRELIRTGRIDVSWEPLAKVQQGVIPAGLLSRNPDFKVPGPRLEACRGDGI